MNPEAPPLVSIIIPTYNRADLITATIDSVLQQTYREIEIIAVDDGSTDQTERVIQKYRDNPKVIFTKRKSSKKGANVCRNEGINASRGSYLLFLDSDDLLAPDCIARRAAHMERHPSLDFSVRYSTIFAEEPGDTNILVNIKTRRNDLDRFLSLDVPWLINNVLWKRSALLRIGGCNEELPSWQDWELHCRALLSGLQYDFLPEIDCYCRQTVTATIGKSSLAPEHLISHFNVVNTLRDLASAQGMMTRRRKCLFQKLYFFIAREWKKKNDLITALQVWDTAKNSTFSLKHLIIRSCLRCRTRYVKVIYAKIVSSLYPQTMSVFGSSTFKRIPVKCGRAAYMRRITVYYLKKIVSWH